MGLLMYGENIAPPAGMSVITLNCIVKESPEAIFQVSISREKSVYKLKKVIKNALPDVFQNIDPIGIRL